MAILNELLASGMTFKQWLLHMLQVTNEADIAVAKALRHMLGVFKCFFFLISCRGIRIFFRNSYRFGIFVFEKHVKLPKRFLNAYRFVSFSKNLPGLEVEIPKRNRFGKKNGGNFYRLLGVQFFRNVS